MSDLVILGVVFAVGFTAGFFIATSIYCSRLKQHTASLERLLSKIEAEATPEQLEAEGIQAMNEYFERWAAVKDTGSQKMADTKIAPRVRFRWEETT